MTWLVDADVKEPVIATGVVASGGTESIIRVGGQLYRLHTFTEDGTFSVSAGGEVQVLVVAGGGSGGNIAGGTLDTFPNSSGIAASGGGGSGGVIECKLLLSGSSNYLVQVGAGGTFDNGGNGNGADSYIALGGNDLVRAKGGGRGGNVTLTASGNAVVDGDDGGSSGGGAYVVNSPLYADQTSDAGDRVFGQGNNGSDALLRVAGGGGGAGEQAQQATIGIPSNGGNGIGSTITGSFQYYGGGGAAASGTQSVFAKNSGGLGGGGSFNPIGNNGIDGLGGGGAGSYATQGPFSLVVLLNEGDGGRGVVIIRYPIEG